jgi:hypothetical protein
MIIPAFRRDLPVASDYMDLYGKADQAAVPIKYAPPGGF